MKKISYPFDRAEILKLKMGDEVLISGKIFTGRDAVHQYLFEKKKSPVSLENQMIYHCGPVVFKNKIIAAGPTTSIRQEIYMPTIIKEQKLLGIIGKGGMGASTLMAMKEYGCVYFNALGGVAQVLAKRINAIEKVHLDFLGSPEAMWELWVTDFPATVTMDAYGESLHEKILAQSRMQFERLIRE